MRDDKIRNALMKMEPDAMLSAKIDAMVDAADLTPREPAVRRVKRPAKAMLIAAAIVVMMAMAVSAVGVFARLFYLPGAGLVDESGVLVIKEDDIGDLDDIIVYKILESVDFGDYSIENVTYTEQNGERSYSVWTQMDELLLNASRGSKGIPFSERVIDDLTLILPDGTELVPESSRWGYSGYIVYNFVCEKLDKVVTVASAALNEKVDVQLHEVTGVGYSYMEYPTDKGITLSIYPVNGEFSQYELAFVDNAIADGLDAFVKGTTLTLPYDTTVFTDENGAKSYIREQHSRFAFLNGGGWSTTSYREQEFIKGSTYNAKKDGYGYYHWLEIDMPASGKITTVEVPMLTLNYYLPPTEEAYVDLPMPADGEYVEKDAVVFDQAGFMIKLTGYERKGSMITIYADSIIHEHEDDVYLSNTVGDMVRIPYSGSSDLTSAWARLDIYCPSSASKTESSGASGAYRGGWYEVGDGRIACSVELEIDDVVADAEDYSFFRVQSNFISCDYHGNWTITY